MSKLRELQCGIGHAILGQDEASIIAAIMGDGLDPAARLNIYRNHYNASLGEALMATFPVVCRLVDPRFFGHVASEFIKVSPPRQVCLFEYGEDFPDFLAEFPACASLVYLADVARLEWLINAALHSPAQDPLETSDLAHLDSADYPRLIFAFQPSLRLIESAWPIDRIWHLNRPGAADEGTVDLAAGGCRLEIRQLGEDVIFHGLEIGDFALRTALASGRALEAAIEAALVCDPAFDPAHGLRRLFAEGLVVGFTLAPSPQAAQE
jgi:Putative DNA-binding domain